MRMASPGAQHPLLGRLFLLTLLAGFLLTLFPLPGKIVWMRPMWVMMVLVYWITMFPSRFGIGVAWLTGVLLDVLNGTLLGEHALAMTVAIFMILRIRTRFRFFPILQQGLIILSIALLYQCVIFCIQGFLGQLPRDWLYWLAPFISLLCWPFVFSLLDYCQRRFASA